jgi:RHS repeat-associated protein
MHKLILIATLCLLLALSDDAFGQGTITGITNPPVGTKTWIYFLVDDVVYLDPGWSLDNGSIIPSNVTGSGPFTYSAGFVFPGPTGPHTINFWASGGILQTYPITVTCPTVANPVATFTYSNQCGFTNVTFTQTPTAGDTWFWQTNPAAPNTNIPASSTTGLTTPGPYYLIAQRNTAQGCWSTGYSVTTTLTINQAPATPTAQVTTVVCSGTLSATAGVGGNSVKWYANINDVNPITTSLSCPAPASSTTYYLSTVNTTTNCESSRIAVPITVNFPATPISGIITVLCSGTMSVSPGANADGVRWYTSISAPTPFSTQNSIPSPPATTTYYVTSFSSTGNCESSRMAVNLTVNLPGLPIPNITSVQCGGTLTAIVGSSGDNIKWYSSLGATTPVSIGTTCPAPPNSTTYYITTFNSTLNCESPRNPVNVTVAPLSNPIPGTTSVVCTGTLTATPVGAGSIRWYANIGDTSPIVSSVNCPSPPSSTTYYITSYNPLTGCESARVAVPITISAAGTPTPGTTSVVCSGNFTATPGAGGNSIKWYANVGDANPIATGTSIPSPPTSTTYYISTYHTAATCESSRIPVVLTVAAPGSPVPGVTSLFCNGSLTASPGSGGNTVRWYANSTDLVPVVTGTSMGAPASTRTFYLSTFNSATGCEGSKIPVLLTVTLPGDPTPLTTTVFCSGTLTAVAGSNGNNVVWYDSPTSSDFVAFDVNCPAPANSATYYIATYNSSLGCQSTRIPVTITVNKPGTPVVPGLQSLTICGPGTIHATPAQNSTTIKWYNAASGGTPIKLDTISPITSATTTYYLASYNPGLAATCESTARTQVTVTITPPPAVSISGPAVLTYGAGLPTLSIPAVQNTYQWIKDGTSIPGATLSTLAVTGPGIYTVRTSSATNPLCNSNPTPITLMSGQSANLVSTTRILKEGVGVASSLFALAPSEVAQNVTYQDGLGRTFQSVAIGASPQGTDIVSSVGYGRQGMVDTTFLPYVTSSRNGLLQLNAIRTAQKRYSGSDQQKFYKTPNNVNLPTDSMPYARSLRRLSPDGRVIAQGAPGIFWQPGKKTPGAHTIRDTITLNTSRYPVRYWDFTGNTTQNYPAGTVMVNIMYDENSHQVRSYTNSQGQTILKQVQLDTVISGVNVAWLETYYVYDQFGRLAYQIPPKAVVAIGSATTFSVASNATTDELVYKYTYDSVGHVVEKKTPGAALEYLVYDKLGRVVLTQDGNLRASNKWNFIKYDYLNRPVYSGIYTFTGTRKAAQIVMNGKTYVTEPYFESPTATAGFQGYTNVAFPTTGITVLSANYYDNYDFNGNGPMDYHYDSLQISGQQEATFLRVTRGMATGNTRAVVDAAGNPVSWLVNVVFYGKYDRPIQTQSNNHLFLTVADKKTIIYDFVKPLKSKTVHNQSATVSVSMVDRSDFDHVGRPLRLYRKINTDPDVLLVEYTYNALGKVVEKNLHCSNCDANGVKPGGVGTFLQSVDYRYNIRGWLTSINNAQLSNDGAMNNDANDYFGMEFFYHNSETSSLGNRHYYNGNISAVKWKSMGAAGTTDQRSYKFTYDKSDRLASATFAAFSGTWTKEAGTLDESMSYDHNGNILTLSRKQNNRTLSGITVVNTAQVVDNLTYTYATGNQLSKVEDAGIVTVGFNDGNHGTAATEYTYNSIGSLTADLNKGITAITYNILGKPQQVTFSDGRVMVYTYDAAGSKLKMALTVGTTTTTTDYVNSFVYTNNVLTFFSSPEGRVVKNGTAYEYQYAIADHQGNTRMIFSSVTPAAANYIATFENVVNDALVFKNIVTTNVVTNAPANHTTGGTKVVRMNQTYKIGPGKSVKVYAGDKIDLSVSSYFTNSSGFGTSNQTVAAMLTSLAAAFGGVNGGAGEPGQIYSGLNSALTNFGLGPNTGNTAPAAYLNYILFDQAYKVVDMGWSRVPASALNTKQQITIPQLTVKEAGYVFVYLSYEDLSNNFAYFDDFQIVHTKTNVIQYNEYYPFGLQTANSWTRENTTGNNFLSNGGTELNTTSNLYDLDFRNYDPVLGRMHQVDPMADSYSSATPYNFSFNDPVYWSDPTGADPLYNETTRMMFGAVMVGGRIMDTGTYGGGRGSTVSFFSDDWMPGSSRLTGGSSMIYSPWGGKDYGGGQYGGLWIPLDSYEGQSLYDNQFGLDSRVVINYYQAFQNVVQYTGTTLINSGVVRDLYNGAVGRNPYSPGSMDWRMYRYDQKAKYRNLTPQPFRAHLNRTRPLSLEYSKALNGQVNNATKTNLKWNSTSTIAKAGGKALVVAGVGMSVYNIATAENKGLAVSQEAGGWAGAISGGYLGSEIGAGIGVWFGGAGAVPGAIVGGIAGSIIGGIWGTGAGEDIYTGN